MFGRRQRQEECLYWEGFRDALVHGARNPGKPISGHQPRYPQGFEDGKRAAKRIHRDALVSEVSRLSLKEGDALIVKSGRSIGPSEVEQIKGVLEPHLPDETPIFVVDPDTKISVLDSRAAR